MNEQDSPPPCPRRIAGPILLGIIPGQPLAVVHRAAELACSLGVELVCAYVDVTAFRVREEPNGSVASQPIDPDGLDEDIDNIPAALQNQLAAALSPYGISWSFRTLAGDPARALGGLAHTLGASITVVGTREHGMGRRIEEFLTGSVAAHLAHDHHGPVLVVPLDPLPWGSST